MLSEFAALRQAIRRRMRRWYRRVGVWGVCGVLSAGAAIFALSFIMHVQRFGAVPLALNYDQWKGWGAALNGGFELGALLLWLAACGVVCGAYHELLHELPPPNEWRMRRALFAFLLALSGLAWLLLVLANILPTVIQIWRQNVLYTPLLGSVMLKQGVHYLAEFLQPALWVCALATLVPARFGLVWLWATPLLLLLRAREIVTGAIQALWGSVYGSDYLHVPLSVFLQELPAPWDAADPNLPAAGGLRWYWLAGGAVVVLTMLLLRRPRRAGYAMLAACALSALWLQLAEVTPSPWKPISSYGSSPGHARVIQARGIALKNGGALGVVVRFGSGPAAFVTTRLAQYYVDSQDSGILVIRAPVACRDGDFPVRLRWIAPLINTGWALLIAAFIYGVVLAGPLWRRT